MPLADTLHDLRLSARALARRPAFTIGVIVTLALGIGANTAIFSVADALLFRPPPFPHPEQLVSVWPSRGHPAGEYFAIRERTKTLSAIGTYSEWQMTLGDDGGSFRADGADLSANLFDLLGARAAIGTTFTTGADVQGAPKVAVLSNALWRTRFGGDPTIVGKSIFFEGVPRTIIGVMPADFHFPAVGTQIWIPSTFTPDQPGNHWGWFKYQMMGRLRPGTSIDAAIAELKAMMPDIRKANTVWDQGPKFGSDATMAPLQDKLGGSARTTMLVLLGVVFALLLVACANVANLVLVRAMSRDRELAVRAALGSSRRQLVVQLLGENLILAVAGGAAAALLAWVGVSSLAAALPPQIPRTAPIVVDLRVLAFTFSLVMLAWLAFGLLPAIRASGTSPGLALAGARGSTRGAAHHRVAASLTIVQLALAVVLVVGSGLLIRSLDALSRVDPGFRPERVLTARVTLPAGTYRDGAKSRAFFDAMLAGLRGTSEISAVGLVDRPPLRGPVYGRATRIEGIAEDVTKALPLVDNWQLVTPGYFEAMGIRVLAGRTFTDDDRFDAPGVVVVSKTTAEKFWPGQDPIGKRLGLPFASPWMTVIGVVADVQDDSLSAPRRVATYNPLVQIGATDVTIVARTTLSPKAFTARVTEAVNAVDRLVPVTQVQSMETIVSTSLARARFTAFLLAGFALLALVLGAVGIYGVVSYTVTERTREFGLRVALGATPSRVLRFVLGQGVRLAALGVLVGVAGAFVAARALSGLLYGVGAADPLTFAVAPLVLIVVALAATFVPAWRAVRVDPLTALRAD